MKIEEVVDELKKVRDAKKLLEVKEDELKQIILQDGRKEIKTANYKLTISIRQKETFNEEAFIEAFSKDEQFNQDTKNKVLKTKVIIDEANLMDLVTENIIPIEYVAPFNSIKETTVINIK